MIKFNLSDLRGETHLWVPRIRGFGGGITAFSRELALALRASGHEVRLFGKTDASGLWNGFPLKGTARFPERCRNLAFATETMVCCARRNSASIISTHLNFGPFARLSKRFLGIPYTLVAHGIDVHPRLSPARLTSLRVADQIIAVSDWTRLRVLALGDIDEDRVQVLPNTYDDARFAAGERPEALVRRYQLHNDEKVILTVARLNAGEGYKGYDRVLQALPEVIRCCGPVRFIIAGKGDDRHRLEAMAQDLGVAAQVTFAGFVPDEELADHYRLADVFAMPSTGEGFGIVFLEAMGCGTPVLGGNQDGSVDAMDGGRLGLLVDPTSVDAIAAGLISLLQRQGSEMWFDRSLLSEAVKQTYGRAAFRRRVSELFPVS